MKKFIFSIALLSIGLISYAQLITPFSIRYTVTQKGDIVIIGNTATNCGTGSSCTNGNCATAHAEMPPHGLAVDNDFINTYIDIDNDASTFMSSSDSLNLPFCSQITFAGLYWGAGGTVGDPDGSHWATRNTLKLKLNNGAYQTLTADATYDNNTGYKSYHNFKNITSLVSAAGIKGRYTIANMPILNDNGTTKNRWGGWVIVVVFKNDLLAQKNLTVFNGLTNVSAANTTSDLPISGFFTPPTGPISLELGLVTYDGDRGVDNTCTNIYKGDSLLFKSAGGFVPIFDAIHPKNDVFNSTISYNGVLTPFRNPSFNNTLGHDANIFIPDNSTKNYISNSATTAILRQKTGGETYLTQVVTTAIDVYEPDLRGGLNVVDLNGGVTNPGDTLEYTMVIKNIGSDPSVNTYVLDTLPPSVTFVPGSIRITAGPNAGYKTDVTGDDQGDFFTSAKSLKIRIGTGANGATGGEVNNIPPFADSTQIKFKVVTTNNCTILLCNNIIQNRFWVVGTGNYSGNTYSNGSNINILDKNGCPLSGTTNTLISATVCAGPTASCNSNICVGGTIHLSVPAVSNATYTWSGPDGFTSTVQNPVITNATLAMAGTYTVIISSLPNCNYATTTTVIVNAPPATPIVSSNSPACTNSNINLSTATVSGVTYNWSGPNGFTSTNQNPVIANVSTAMAGTYSLTLTNNTTGCTSRTGTTAVTILPLPIAPTVSSNSAVCETATINLTAGTMTGTSYSWTGPNGFTSTDQNPIIPNATLAMNGVYNLIVTDAATGCASVNGTGTTTVVVNPLPIAPTVTSNSAVCETATISLTTGTMTGTTYSWTGPNGFTSTDQNPIIPNATLSMNGVYNLIVTDAATGCASVNGTGTTTVVVNPLPVAPSISSNSAVCETATISLTTGTMTGTTYSWTGPNGFTSTDQNPIIPNATLAMNGVYNLIVTDAATGCASVNGTGTTTVVVNPLPIAPTVSNNSAVCETATINLTAGTMTGTSYSWTGPNGFTSTDQNPIIPNATLAMNGVYNLIVTDAVTGCASVNGTGTTTVVVNPLPIAPTVSSNSAVCENATINLTAGTMTGTSYSWTGPNGFTSTDQNPIIPNATLAMNGVYNLIVTDAATGCASVNGTGTTTVVVNPLPTVTANTSSTNICDGSSITLTGSGATSYSWTGGITDGLSFIPSSSGTYIVTGTDINGCSNSASVNIIVNPLPLVIANESSAIICKGSSLTLTGSGASTYIWTGGVTDGISFAPLTSGTYTVIGTDENGCSSTASISVTVDILTVTANASSTSICHGSSITLTGGGASTYSWTNGVTNGVAFIPETTASYTVTGTDENGCTNTSSVSVSVEALHTVDSIPNQILCSNSNTVAIEFTGNSESGFDWTNSNTLIGLASNGTGNIASFTATNPGPSQIVATITVTPIANECPGVSTSFTITVNYCLHIEFFIPEGFSPNGDGINDLFVIRGIDNYPTNKFVIFNRWGNKIYEASPYQNKWDGTTSLGLTVGGNELPVGTYFYILDLGDGSDIIKGTIYLNR